MTIAQMQVVLASIGLKKPFKPIWDNDFEMIAIKTREPATYIFGRLHGTEIVLENDFFRVWTSRKLKAASLARARSYKVRLWDGEAELWVPAVNGDEILPLFGAVVKKELSPERMEALKAGMRSLNARISRSTHGKNAVPATLPLKTAPEPM